MFGIFALRNHFSSNVSSVLFISTFSEHLTHPAVCPLQVSSSTWPCTVSASAGDSGPSGSWTWRTSATTTPRRAATRPVNSPIWASSPARTLSRTIRTRTRTRHTLTHRRTRRRRTATLQATRCMILTWTQSALKSTSSSVDKTYTHRTHHVYAHGRRELHPNCTHAPYLFERKKMGSISVSAEKLRT